MTKYVKAEIPFELKKLLDADLLKDEDIAYLIYLIECRQPKK